MVSVTFLLDYIELLRRGGTRAHATWGTLLEMAALKLPHTAQDVMPFAILFGTMLAFWRLTRSNELVVARAAGVSVWGFLTPAILVALLVGVVAVTLFNPIASAMQASFEKLDNRILRQAGDPLSLSNAGLWLRQTDAADGQIVFHGDKLISPDLLASPELQLRNASVYFLNRRSEFTSRIEARAARLDGGFWVIEDGQRFRVDGAPEPFAELRLPTSLTASKIEESLTSRTDDHPGRRMTGSPRPGHRLLPERAALALVGAILALLFAAAPSVAELTISSQRNRDKNAPIVFQADEVQYDDQLALTVAK